MKIVRRHETWVHTHFITDCERLTKRDMRRIEKEMAALLRQLRIVYGIHFREPEKDEGIHVVLECIPQDDYLEAIEARLKEIIEPIPKKPEPVKMAVPKTAVGEEAGKFVAEGTQETTQ